MIRQPIFPQAHDVRDHTQFLVDRHKLSACGRIAVADQPLIAPDHLYVGGILPAELADEMEVVRRGACMTLDEVAANIGISRPQLSNARMGRFGLSASAADRLMVWLSQPPPIRQMSFSLR